MAIEEGEDPPAVEEQPGKLSRDQVVIRSTDMPKKMQEEAISAALDALAACSIEKDAAIKIKQLFDSNYSGTTWHCVVGKRFAASTTYQTKSSIFFSIGPQTVLLFKSSDDIS